MPGANQLFTVANEMFKCGINSPALFQEDSQAILIDGKVFDDDFMSCIDKTVKELGDDLKSHSTLLKSNGQICLNLGQRNNVKAFIQWTRDQYHWGLDATLTLFKVTNVAQYINRCNHHESFIKKAYMITDTAKPEQFTDKMKCIDWYPTLINFLRAIS